MSEPTYSSITIDLLRHGQVETQGLFCASPSEPLSEKGWLQLEEATRLSSGVSICDRLICSPAKRCYDFSVQLSESMDVPLEVNDALQEMDFGDWQGVAREDIWRESPDQLALLWQSPEHFSAPGGESMEAFSLRVRRAWSSLVASMLAMPSKESALVVTHAGVIRVLLSIILDIAYSKTLSIEIPHACRVRVRCYSDGQATLVGIVS